MQGEMRNDWRPFLADQWSSLTTAMFRLAAAPRRSSVGDHHRRGRRRSKSRQLGADLESETSIQQPQARLLRAFARAGTASEAETTLLCVYGVCRQNPEEQ